MTDRMHIRWLTFCAVRTFPQDSNDIMIAVATELNLNVIEALVIAEELGELHEAGIVVVHAEDEARDLLEVRLRHEEV
jgi:hypothetical protein